MGTARQAIFNLQQSLLIYRRVNMILIILIVLVVLYFYTTRNHGYWSKRNVKHDPPIPIFGNQFRNICALKSVCEVTNELYNKYPNEKVVGSYRGNDKELIIRDPEIARDILSVDFQYFYARGLGRDTKKEPLLLNVFHADNDSWKLLRQRLTPAFSTAKLKAMFPLIIKCAEKLIDLGKDIVDRGGDCDGRELMARFSTEFIGACGFGIEMDTINNENSMFRQLGKRIFSPSTKKVIMVGIWDIFPEGRKSFINLADRTLERVLYDIVRKVIEQRNYKPSGRNDFVDLLLDLATQGKIVGESIADRNPDGTPKQVEMEMDFDCLVAQVFVFFAAGFETSSSAASYILHELAFHPEIQRKAQEEIDRVLNKYDNKLCYEAVSEMKYLDMVLKEALRLMPSLGNLNRLCVRKYTIKQLGISIDPGVKIIIPIQAMQLDKKYFDDPLEFRPERFADEDINKRTKYVYMPFGEGPRACIGARLGQMQSLAGLAIILHKFSVEPSDKTKRTLDINPRLNVVQGVLNGVPIRLTRRNK